MKSQLLINPDKIAIVQLTRGDYWLRLVLSLTNEFTGGDIVRFGHSATISVEGADTLSSSYRRSNWISGVASGALYAFRALGINRQFVVIAELAGRLRASDMEALANGAAIAVAKLAERELPAMPTEEWTISAQIAAAPAISSDADRKNGSASSGGAILSTQSVG